jgi:hypothetical protein
VQPPPSKRSLQALPRPGRDRQPGGAAVLPLTRDRLSAISAIPPGGRPFPRVRERALRGPDVVEEPRYGASLYPTSADVRGGRGPGRGETTLARRPGAPGPHPDRPDHAGARQRGPGGAGVPRPPDGRFGPRPGRAAARGPRGPGGAAAYPAERGPAPCRARRPPPGLTRPAPRRPGARPRAARPARRPAPAAAPPRSAGPRPGAPGRAPPPARRAARGAPAGR